MKQYSSSSNLNKSKAELNNSFSGSNSKLNKTGKQSALKKGTWEGEY